MHITQDSEILNNRAAVYTSDHNLTRVHAMTAVLVSFQS